jgi:hypothetical protein
MFLGGSYHDRDNPHMWGVSHGQLIVFITLGCTQKDGRQQSSSRRGPRTSVADDEMMMRMTMMMINFFYGGIGTKCTEHQIVMRNQDRNDDDDDGKDDDDGTNLPAAGKSDGNNTNTNTTNKNNKSPPEDHQWLTTTMWEVTPPVARLDQQPDLLPTTMGMMATADRHNRNKTNSVGAREDNDVGCSDDTAMEEQHSRKDDDDVDDGGGDREAVCDWYTRQKNQPSLTKSMPLQQQPPATQDTRSLADDTVVNGNRRN